MPRQIKDDIDIKIFILEMLKQIDIPVDLSTLNAIVIQDGFVNGFDFLNCFYDLTNTRAIEKIIDDNGDEKYKITEQGSKICSSLDSRDLYQIRNRAARSAMSLISFQNRKAKVSSSIEKLDNGKIKLVCKASEKDNEFFRLELSLDNQLKANNFKDNYDENPEFIYRAVLGLLSGDINYLAKAWQDDLDKIDDEDNEEFKEE